MRWFYYKFIYRRLMTFMHSHDWHKMERNPWIDPENIHFRCHWCGLTAKVKVQLNAGAAIRARGEA